MNKNKKTNSYLSQIEKAVWKKAENCKCKAKNCESTHKICAICVGMVLHGAHVSVQPNSEYSWSIDHIIPESKFEVLRGEASKRGYEDASDIRNLQITHVKCNAKKGDFFDPSSTNGYSKNKIPF